MKLLYVWIEKFRNIERQGFVVDNEYLVTVNSPDTETIEYLAFFSDLGSHEPVHVLQAFVAENLFIFLRKQGIARNGKMRRRRHYRWDRGTGNNSVRVFEYNGLHQGRPRHRYVSRRVCFGRQYRYRPYGHRGSR